MHTYVQQVISAIRGTEPPATGSFVRVVPGADQEKVRNFLTEERQAADEAVSSLRGPVQLTNYSVTMQMLIIIELLLAKPEEPIDVRALSLAQGHGSGYVSERIEEAAEGLLLVSRMVAPDLLEMVTQI